MFEGLKVKAEAEILALISQNKHLVADFVGRKAANLINDDAAVTALSQRLYVMLPASLRALVGRDTFTTFLLNNREKLASAISSATQAPAAKPPSS